MEGLLRDRIPHAPQLGLYVAPDIPAPKLSAALASFGQSLGEPPLALYDATRFGTGRSGALFGARAFCFQNLVETPQRVAYSDLVGIDTKKSLLGGRRLVLLINRARATFEHEMDFSARGEALPYVEAFLRETLGRIEVRASSPDDRRIEQALELLETHAPALTDQQRARLRHIAGPS